jgi:hypothetical protein
MLKHFVNIQAYEKHSNSSERRRKDKLRLTRRNHSIYVYAMHEIVFFLKCAQPWSAYVLIRS